jgi:hypothetical protein
MNGSPLFTGDADQACAHERFGPNGDLVEAGIWLA